MIFTFPATLLFLFAGDFVAKMSMEYDEKKRIELQKLRNGIAEAACKGEIKKYCLFLRPFAIAEKIEVPSNAKLSLMLKFFNIQQKQAINIEEFVVSKFSGIGPVIGLSYPRDNKSHSKIGIVYRFDWQDVFKKMAIGSVNIFILPLEGDGTRWEIAWLKQNRLLNKCVFLMPPYSFVGRSDVENMWSAAKTIMALEGIYLPAYRKKPSGIKIFSVGENGNHKGLLIRITKNTKIRKRNLWLLEKTQENKADTDCS